MVERLKAAIDKARVQRAADGGAPTGPDRAPPPQGDDSLWSLIEPLEPDPARLERNRVISAGRADPAHIPFDVLRTRLSRVCAEKGWRRIGITSPTKGCGKSMVALNLAFSLARQPMRRTVLIDGDLKAPMLGDMLGHAPRPIEDWLAGRTPLEAHFQRIGERFALGLNSTTVSNSAELVQSASAAQAMQEAGSRLDADIVIVDLPPLLVTDDAIAMLPHLDGVLLVVAAGESTPQEVEASERLLADNCILIGVLLNKAVVPTSESYHDSPGYA